MRICEELFDEIFDLTSVIHCKFKINIGIGYPYTFGCNPEITDFDFILYRTKKYFYIMDNNNYLKYGKLNAKILSSTSIRLTKFFINYFTWLRLGLIKVEEWREYKGSKYNWKWKPEGDGRYNIERYDSSDDSTLTYLRTLDKFDPEEKELKLHILGDM